MKKKSLCLLCMVAMWVLVFSITVFAYTDIPEGHYSIKNVNSNCYLTNNGIEKENNITQESKPRLLTSQKFLIYKSNTIGTFAIAPSNAHELALDVSGASSADNANIISYKRNYTNAQKWKFLPNSDGSFKVLSACTNFNKGLHVEGNSVLSGANVTQNTDSKSSSWYLEAEIDEGLYYIKNKQTGLYLTLDGQYIKTKKLNYLGSQRFKITVDSNGYYELCPEAEFDYSIEEYGWNTGRNTEGSIITASYGEGSEGQSWKFMLNANGSYRIVSQASGDVRAITAVDNVDGGLLYSYIYNKNNSQKYAEWELVRVKGDNNYYKEGEHVVIEVTSENLNRKHISPDNLRRWITHLDAVYEKYYELVGTKPQMGEKLIIVEGSTNADGGLNCFPNTKLIIWNNKNVANDLILIDKYDDWSFGVLHEMGHAFDVKYNWVFDDEFSANFKMAYVLKKLDGDFTILLNREYKHKYDDVISYYKNGAYKSYDNCFINGKFVYDYDTVGEDGEVRKNNGHDALVYMFLDCIEKNNGWNDVAQTYRDMVLSSCNDSGTKIGRYNYWLACLGQGGNKLLVNAFLQKYGVENEKIKAYYSK